MPHPSLAWTIAGILLPLLNIYFWIVVISAILSWINPDPYNPIVRFIYSITEPVFEFVREHVPVIFGGVDLSPIVVIAALKILAIYVIPVLANLLTYGSA